eukprot:TRINITY_DN23682_c0_g1_i1.p1 TRINITY_DN23682_c0_g1~~TRINITY_DN23682_c0_g1_i1.p1  ORF type:complete len:569 (+),score=146.90 TRINITY_DN23682_c0_g1_i1:50-1756(+)
MKDPKKEDEGKSERMIVVVRVRVLTERERKLCAVRYPHRVQMGYKCIECVGNDIVAYDPDSPATSGSGRRYTFDRVFDSSATNDEVYSFTVKPLLQGLLDGYNATCFAYGMTGAGKTFTMMGTDRVKGLCYMAVEDLFPLIEECGGESAVHASYLEIYNEKVKDLLSKDGDRRHDIIEDPQKGVVVTDLAEYLVTNLQDLHTLMALGCEKRTRASTASNVVSSRSHAILLITVRHQSGECERVLTMGKLALIDLAGSERGSGDNPRGVRMQEGANINRSLLALGNCITILGSGKERKHVPYRDSKLTRLLRDSLGGNTRTVMIGNTSPSSTCYEEMISTLKYATRARNISRTVTRNAITVDPAHPPRGTHPALGLLKTDVEQMKTQLMVQQCEREGIGFVRTADTCFTPVARCRTIQQNPTRADMTPVRGMVDGCKYLLRLLDNPPVPAAAPPSITHCSDATLPGPSRQYSSKIREATGLLPEEYEKISRMLRSCRQREERSEVKQKVSRWRENVARKGSWRDATSLPVNGPDTANRRVVETIASLTSPTNKHPSSTSHRRRSIVLFP